MGDAAEVAARLRAHVDAGADHVCVDPLGRAFDHVPVAALEGLAGVFAP